MFTSGSGSNLRDWQLWWEERAVVERGTPECAGMEGPAPGEPQGACRHPGTHCIPAWENGGDVSVKL